MDTLEKDRQRCMDISRERGDFVMGDDGYYVFWPKEHTMGALASYHLRWLADELDRINKPWDDQVQAFFEKENAK